MRLRLILVLAFAVRFGLGAAWAQAEASPRPLRHGLAANIVLGQGLGPRQSLESGHSAGFKAQQIMQGLACGGGPVVDVRGAGGEDPPPTTASSDKAEGLRTSEPPAPDVGLPGMGDGEEEDRKEGWRDRLLKGIQKWLPIAMFYYGSVTAILNPMGAAAGAARGMAGIALIGTAILLYKTIRNK